MLLIVVRFIPGLRPNQVSSQRGIGLAMVTATGPVTCPTPQKRKKEKEVYEEVFKLLVTLFSLITYNGIRRVLGTTCYAYYGFKGKGSY